MITQHPIGKTPTGIRMCLTTLRVKISPQLTAPTQVLARSLQMRTNLRRRKQLRMRTKYLTRLL